MSDFVPQFNDPINTYLVSDCIEQAYRMAGALMHPGQGISNSESAEGLKILNFMVDAWKIESLLIIYFQRTIQTMNPGQKSYGVGPGQDFNSPRPPQNIHRAGYIVGDEPTITEVAMSILLNYQEYADFAVKDVQSDVPLVLYYQPSAPYGTATFWPVPAVTSQVAIYTPAYLSEFQAVDDALEMPYGYYEMVMYNLAVRVHERYPEKPMLPSVEARAAAALRKVRNVQWTPIFIGSDPATMQEGYARRWFGGNAKSWVPYTGNN